MFDFLAHSLLTDPTLIAANYDGETDQRLECELESYRKHCIAELDRLTVEVSHVAGSLSCVGSAEMGSLSSLKRAALYIEQMILPDPIFPFTAPKSAMSSTMSGYLGMGSSSEKLNRVALAGAVKDVLSKRDMVVGGYLKFYPVSYHDEAPVQIPIYYDANGYTDLVPTPILQIFREKSEIFTAESTPGGLIVTDRLEPCRKIFINFKGTRPGTGFIYNLMSQETLSFDDETRIAQFRLSTPSFPPSQAHFDKWVAESLARSAGSYFRGLTTDISLAQSLSSVYACSSSFDSQLLRSSMMEVDKGIPENAIECVLKMKLPYMDKISSRDLMSLRNNDGEAFQSFRTDLEARFRELRYESDSIVIRRKIVDIEHEMSEVQVKAISNKIKSVRRAAVVDLGLAFSGLAAAVVTSGVSLFGTLTAALHGAKTYAEYRKDVKENPCYFLFEAKRLTKSQKPEDRQKKVRSSGGQAKITRLSATGGVLRDSEQ
ncbi:hypothetical protein PSH77_25215 [Pseudomonas extremorientalis]|jgi:hypothetical protein|uniref:hypothetical protein n=1 Tax=Pseudomonas extremorientalis TaxID=169669 RepID=UPI00273252E8|nr:hypothetical protein [Pseudomonas extremorientalis]WLG55926.1 hypothetical protein PSH77_25215 [Pseudomonas extremorientalis]